MTNNRNARFARSNRNTIARNIPALDCQALAALGHFDAYTAREPLRIPADVFIAQGEPLAARDNSIDDDDSGNSDAS